MGMDELIVHYNADKMEVTISPITSARLHNLEEVVRCVDCKYYEHKDVNLLPHCTLCGITKAEDDYCSCGERKDNERKAD